MLDDAKRRIDEMETLEMVLATLASINQGSGFLENMHFLIDEASKLRHDDLRTNRVSFVRFIRDQLWPPSKAKE